MGEEATTPGWQQSLHDADLVVELAPDTGIDTVMRFRRIPAGEFWMGSRGEDHNEEPRHRVRITREFFMGTFPVTQREFAVWTRAAGVEHRNVFAGNSREGTDLRPAESLTWNEAVAFCDWLTETFGVTAGWTAALPLEAQWEYACRAGTSTAYWSGDGEAALAEVGWYVANSGSTTHAVGKKPANKFGLYDVHGNVLEWCRDAWTYAAYCRRVDGVTDRELLDAVVESEQAEAASPESVGDHVFRGGSCRCGAGNCRAACKPGWGPADRDEDRGFRVSLLPGPVVSASPESRGARSEAERAGSWETAAEWRS